MINFSPAQSLLQNLILPEDSIIDAEKAWKTTAEEVVRGLSKYAGTSKAFTEYVKLQDRYLSIARYCDDATRLIGFHAARQDATLIELMAIDPHIMREYAEPWGESAHKGFFFLDNEAPKDSDNEAQRFPIFTYNANFNIGHPIILSAGRSEISGHLAYFTKVAAGEITSTSQLNEPMDIGNFLNELQVNFRQDTSKSSNLQSAFERLILAGGAPHMKQQLALSRLIGLMKRKNFHNPEAAIKNACIDNDLDKELSFFIAHMKFLANNPAFLNPVRQQITDAYVCFTEVEDTLSALQRSRGFHKRDKDLRGGELEDLNALIEVHVLNSCLQLCKLPIKINYVTLSLRMFNFVRQFDRNLLKAPLLHPRSAMMLHSSQLFDQHKDEMTKVVANAIAFARAIPENKTIAHSEIDRFERDFGDVLTSTRNTFLHSAADSEDERARMVQAIDRIVSSAEEEHHEKWSEIRLQLSSQLSSQVSSVGSIFREKSSSLANSAWTAYQQFASDEDRTDNIHVNLRIFRDEVGEGARLVVMPLQGSYRYKFIIYNTDVVKLFESHGDHEFRKITIGVFLKTIDSEEFEEHENALLSKKRIAIRFFSRAVFAASRGQWTLAESLATQAIEMLEEENLDNSDPALEGEVTKARAQLTLQELFFLRHMCRRAVAQGSDPYRGKLAWLRRAAQDLFESSRLTIEVPRKYSPYETEFNPTSLRQALAAIGLQIEWMVSLYEKTGNFAPIKLLYPTYNSDIAWSDIGLDKSLEPETDNFLFEFSSLIRNKIKNIYNELQKSGSDLHKEEDWRYLLLRAESMPLLIQACVDISLLPETCIKSEHYNDNSENLFEVARLLDEHKDWIAIERTEDGFLDVDKSPNPFLSALISAANIRQRVSFDPERNCWLISNQSELYASFAKLDGNCNFLDPYGFPRAVIKAIKKKYVPALLEHMTNNYSNLHSIDSELFDAVPEAGEFGI